jgi:hypothetical protein
MSAKVWRTLKLSQSPSEVSQYTLSKFRDVESGVRLHILNPPSWLCKVHHIVESNIPLVRNQNWAQKIGVDGIKGLLVLLGVWMKNIVLFEYDFGQADVDGGFRSSWKDIRHGIVAHKGIILLLRIAQ